MKIKNKNLYEQLKKTTFTALDYMKGYPIITQSFPPIHELSGLKDFTDCVAILFSDSMINQMFGKNVGIYRQLGLLLPDWVVKTFLLRFYVQSKVFKDDIFDKLYLDLEEFLYTENIRVIEKTGYITLILMEKKLIFQKIYL